MATKPKDAVIVAAPEKVQPVIKKYPVPGEGIVAQFVGNEVPVEIAVADATVPFDGQEPPPIAATYPLSVEPATEAEVQYPEKATPDSAIQPMALVMPEVVRLKEVTEVVQWLSE